MTDRDNSRTNRRRLIGLLAVGIPAALLAKQKGQGKGQANGQGKNKKTRIQPVFSPADRTAIFVYVNDNRGFVAPEARRLPPGLAKNLRRGKPLPPGWARKIAPFPIALEQRLPPLQAGYRRVVVDRWAFVIAEATNTILDVVDLINHR